MADRDNAEVVRKGYEAFSKGDVAAFDDILTPNCVWHVPGRGQLAGDKRGKDAVVAYFTRLGELSGGSIAVDLHDVIANDDHVVGLHRTSAHRGEQSYETTEAVVFHMRDGRIAEAWEHPYNLYAQDEIFG